MRRNVIRAAIVLSLLGLAGCAGKKETSSETLTTATELGDFGPRSPAGTQPGGFGNGSGSGSDSGISGGPIFGEQDAGTGIFTDQGAYDSQGSSVFDSGASVYNDSTIGYEGGSAIDGAGVGVGGSYENAGTYDSTLFDTSAGTLDGGFNTYGDPGSDALGGISFPGDDGGPSYFAQQVGDVVRFDTDSAVLSADARETLRRQVAWLQLHPEIAVTIEGHADERGTREHNLALGASRANSVRSYLTSLGIGVDRIRTVSFGKERPVALGSTPSDWARNRRAVTVLRSSASF